MTAKKNILAIIGSASTNSSNHLLVKNISILAEDYFNITVFDELKTLPHFDPVLTDENVPKEVETLRKQITEADGIIICTPEYIFSIPSGLKNMIEWCVSTTIFSEKPIALITASAQGKKAHEELQLLMQTLMANFNDATTLLIPGIKSRFDEKGRIKEGGLTQDLSKLLITLNISIN